MIIVPFGAVSGYVSVAMAFLATKSGLSVGQAAALIFWGMLPHTLKFFWAPVADTTLSRKRWYLISVAICAIGMCALGAIPLSPENLRLLEGVNLLTNIAATFLGMSAEGLMAHATPPNQRGRVGGWFQAGNLGGSGLGGGAGLWMATSLPSEHAPVRWISGAVLGAAFLACAAALLFVPEAAAETREGSLLSAMRRVLVEIWRMIKSRAGMLCAVLCVLPIGTGAATNVLSQAEVAANWGVAEDTVGLVNGTLNGVISAFGCLVCGEICARYSSRRVYAVVGLLMALVAAGMAVAPLKPWSYVVFILAYAFTSGLAYAAFTGFVLDAIGKGAAATKYNAFASLSNAPIAYMGLVLAWVYAWKGWGGLLGVGTASSTALASGPMNARGMLFTEAGAGVLGLVVLAGAVAAVRKMRDPAFLHCPRCKYNLTGLEGATRCPECGAELGVAMRA